MSLYARPIFAIAVILVALIAFSVRVQAHCEHGGTPNNPHCVEQELTELEGRVGALEKLSATKDEVMELGDRVDLTEQDVVELDDRALHRNLG